MKIVLEDLHKSFGDLKVLDGLNLQVESGERLVIMGRSGQGKSVLLKHLTGLVQPDSGRILIDGKDLTRMREAQLHPLRMRFGMIFQNAGLLQSLNVEENVALPLLEARGANREDVMHRVGEKLAMVGLAGREKQSVSTLSGGQQKRVAIARALLQNAECLLFDEPTAGLDPPLSKTVDDVILQVNRETNATIVVVTHDLTTAFAVGQRLCLLHQGRIVEDGTPDEFRRSTNPIVQEFLEREAQKLVVAK